MFNRIKSLSLALLLSVGIAGAAMPITSHADSPNLVQNPSFEQAASGDSSTPADWYPESYGTNTAAFTYLTTGHTGSHAVQTTVSNYQNGDAKWLFNAVPVTDGASYTYSDYYEATAATNLFAQYTMSDGSFQYAFLASEATAASWTQDSVSLTIPSGVTELSVFHVIAANGSLAIDDVSLTQPPVCALPTTNGLVNGDFEVSCDGGTTPGGWQTETYNDTSASFPYTADAHSGSKAVEITNQLNSGEAGWKTTLVNPASNQHYTLDFWQNSTTYVYAYLEETLANGTVQDVSLMSVPSSDGSWSEYHDSFITPANLAAATVTIATSGVGSVNLDQVTLNSDTNQTPPTFTSGLVSLTFDDGDSSTYDNGQPILTQNGFTGTYYINADNLNLASFMTSADLQTLVKDGDEIGSHLYDHDDIVQLTSSQLNTELSENISALQAILGSNYNVSDFASPYGSFTSGTVSIIKQYEASHRDTDGQLNSKANFDPYQIHAVLVTPTTKLAAYKQMIAEAQANHEWLVLVYHNIGKVSKSQQSTGEAGYTVSTANFTKQIAALKASGVAVAPVNAALTNLEAQENN